MLKINKTVNDSTCQVRRDSNDRVITLPPSLQSWKLDEKYMKIKIKLLENTKITINTIITIHSNTTINSVNSILNKYYQNRYFYQNKVFTEPVQI